MQSPEGEGNWLIGEMGMSPVWLESSEKERKWRRRGGRRWKRRWKSLLAEGKCLDLTVSTRTVTDSFKQAGGVIWFMLLKDHAGYTGE